MTLKTHLSTLLLVLALVWGTAANAQDKGTLGDPPGSPSQSQGTLSDPTGKSPVSEPTKRKPSPGKSSVSGTVTLNIIQAGVLVSASGGDGVLTFRNKRYPFRIGGVGIGVIGASKAYASGEVYNLNRIEDFPGTFVKGQAGYAFGEGKSTLWLENTNGVVLKLRSTTKGASLSLSGEGLRVEMGKSKKTAKKN